MRQPTQRGGGNSSLLCSKWKKRRQGKPLPIAFQTKEVRRRGFPRCVRNGRKGDGGSPSPSHSKQKCDKEGFPVMFKTENATRMRLPLPIASKMKENATRRGSPPPRHVQNIKRDDESLTSLAVYFRNWHMFHEYMNNIAC